MYFLAGKNGIRKLTDYRYRIPGATPTPTGEGEKNLRITGIGSPYQQYNGDYRRDQSAVYATPGTAGQQWTQDGGGGKLTIDSAGQWALTMGNVTSNSDKLATAGWPWESVFLWDSMGPTVTMVIAALDDDNPESAWRQIVGDDKICSASGNFQIGDDTHTVVLGKDYPVVSVGSDEIAQLWTGENLDVGELGFYYNNDPAIGAAYGSLVGADMATLLDYKLRGVEYNPVIDGRIDFNSFLPVFRSIGIGDFELEIKFDLGPLGKNAYIFQMPASNNTAYLGVLALTSTDGRALIESSCMLIGTSYQLLAVPYTTGIHTAKISRAAGVVTIDIDGTLQSRTGDVIDLSAATMAAPYNDANCVLRSVKLTSGGVSKWAIDGVPLETPSRYTLPSRAHLDALVTMAGGSAIAGKMLKSAGSVSDGGAWADPPEGSEDAAGVDRFGFAMLPGGIRSTTFAGLSQLAFLGSPGGFYLRMEYGVSSALSNTNTSYWMSVRALKTRGELVLDGQKIPTVLVGMQSWTAENLTGFGGTHVETVSDIYGDYYTYAQTMALDEALKASGSTCRVPRKDEFAELIATVDSGNAAAIKDRESWVGYGGKDISGFTALAGGYLSEGTIYNAGSNFLLSSITTTTDDTRRVDLRLTSASHGIELYEGSKGSGISIRLVKRFYDVLMPWGQMLRFVKIGSLFIAQKNLAWRGQSGTLGRYYNDDPALAHLGLLYTPAEAEILRKYFRDAGLPFDIPANTVFISTLATYDGGTVDTQGKKLKATTGWTSESAAGTDDYEFTALPGGERGTDGRYQSLGSIASFLVRYGDRYSCDRMYGSNSKILGGWAVDADNAVAAAYIRLVYEVS